MSGVPDIALIHLVPAESMEPRTACSAPTVRPVVSITARIIPSTMMTVNVEATGCERAEAMALSRRRHPKDKLRSLAAATSGEWVSTTTAAPALACSWSAATTTSAVVHVPLAWIHERRARLD